MPPRLQKASKLHQKLAQELAEDLASLLVNSAYQIKQEKLGHRQLALGTTYIPTPVHKDLDQKGNRLAKYLRCILCP